MNNIINLLDISVDKIKSMVDVNVVMGKMMTYNNVSVIPISKVKCGFISGGVDQKENQETKKNPFGGASGGTMTLTPIAFLVILENDAKVLHLDEHSHILENLIDKPKKIAIGEKNELIAIYELTSDLNYYKAVRVWN